MSRLNCNRIGCDLSKKQKITLGKTQNEESNLVTISSSLVFTRSCLPIQNLGANIQILQSGLVDWFMYCVTLRLHDIKKLISVSVEYTMEVHLADASIFYLSSESPPSPKTLFTDLSNMTFNWPVVWKMTWGINGKSFWDHSKLGFWCDSSINPNLKKVELKIDRGVICHGSQ